MTAVKIPGLGPVKKPYLIAGVGITAGILIYAYWRRAHSAPPATTGSGDTSSTGSSGAIDPSTGLPYGQASDGTGYGYPGYGGYGGGSPYSQYGYDIYGNPLPASTGLPNNNAAGAYSNNHDWYVAALADLETAGYTESVAGQAITKVLGGLSVTSEQRAIFLRAVGLLGQPPQGYPTPIKVVDTPGHPGGGGSGSVPAAPHNVHAVSVGRDHVTVGWDAVSGATRYTLYRDGHKVTDTTSTTATSSGLQHGHRYLFTVNAWNSHGRGPSGAVTTATHH